MLAANQDRAVRTLIVSPPLIYGPGRGAVNQRSIQAYNMAKFTLENGFAPVMSGSGSPQWDNVHVHDLGNFFALAVGAALDPAKQNDREIWGPRAYYFLEHGSHSWRGLAEQIAKEAHRQGLIDEPKTQEGVYKNYGANSISVAARARKYLGWKPSGRSLADEVPDIVAGEAKLLKERNAAK